MSKPADVQKVFRKTAKSGKVDYAATVLLNETPLTRLEARALFIPHSDRSELMLKVEGFRRRKGQPWVVEEKRTLDLSELACIRLLNVLQTHLPVASQPATGDFLVIRVANGEAHLDGQDPQELVSALTQVLSQEELAKHLATTELTHELATALRGSIRLSEMRAAVADLRATLDRGEALEQVYQAWCEKHCWAFGNAYVVRDDVRAISTGDNLDLVLPTVIAGYRDIVELKRPDKDVLLFDAAHKNYYLSADVSRAIGQSHRYLDILHDAAKHGLLDHREVVAYHPRATIVIGRSHTWTDDQQRALHGLNRRMNGISVMTYDHLLAQGKRLIEMMIPNPSEPIAAQPIDADIPW